MRLLPGVLAVVAVTLLAGSAFELAGRRQARRDFPVQGRLVDIGGRRIQLDCRGAGSPTVVFEAGLDLNGSLAWSLVQDSIARTTRSCAYRRAGVLWSDRRRDRAAAVGAGIAEDLHAVLAGAGERAPYVLVGHSLGGPYIMTYTKKYGAEVAGLVFVDASHPDQGERLRTPALWRIAAALSWSGLVRAALPADPRSHEPPPATRAMAAYASTSLGPMLRELDALDATLAEAGSLRRLGDWPTVVLTATASPSAEQLASQGKTRAQADSDAARWRALQEDEASWSSRSRHELVQGAGHEIQFDRPDAVIAAVRSVVDSVRAVR